MSEPRTYEYVCDARTPKRVRDALAGRQRRLVWIVTGFLTVCGVLLAGLGDLTDAVIVGVGGAVGAGLLLRSTSVRQFQAVGAGTVLRSTFRDADADFVGPLSSSTVPFTSFAKMEIRKEIVVYKLRGSRLLCALPIQILPPNEVARIKAGAGI